MERQEVRFGNFFTKFRLKAEFLTLSEFGRALADEGLLYEDSIFSRWQKGNRIPKDRHLLLTIIKIFVKRRGITSLDEANIFLEAANHGYLTLHEEKDLFGENITKNLFLYQPGSPVLDNTEHFQETLDTISNSNDKLNNIEGQIDLLHEKLYEGYAQIAYKRLGLLADMIRVLKLNQNQYGKDLLTKIGWIRLRTYADLCDAKTFPTAIKEADAVLQYAKQSNTVNIGPVYWTRSMLLRLALLTGSKEYSAKQYLYESRDIQEMAKQHTLKNSILELIYEHVEQALIALIPKDQKLFETEIAAAIDLLSLLPNELKYTGAVVWETKARGVLRFKKDIDKALDTIHIAKSFTKPRYQTVNLYVRNTELQILETSPNPAHHQYAGRLRDMLRMEISLLGNSYQKMRLEKKKLLGL